LSAPVLPVIRMTRVLRFTAARRPHALGAVLWSLPALLLSQYASALGQSIGLLAGEGRSRHEFLVLDLDAPRDEPAPEPGITALDTLTGQSAGVEAHRMDV
jgi:hypothetical protein